MSITKIIIQKIQKEGPVSFRDFMELALYHPQAGYYTSGREKIGKNGDFYTSPYLGPLFGKMIAKQLEEMWCLLDKKPFTIVEYGAGTGNLCRDILEQLRENKKMYDQLRYCIIEKSPEMREREKRLLRGNVSWYNSLSEIPSLHGCILSNEVVDNFSVHQVMMEDELMEVFVDYKDGFIESLQPASAALKNYITQLEVTLPKGCRTEINLEAIDWIRNIGIALQKGFVLTIDYGYGSAGLYNEQRSAGTLICYHKHGINYCPYINIGEQDITSHVNFSALRHWGSKYGLEYGGYTSQAYFLMGLGLSSQAQQIQADEKSQRLLHTFLVDMGNRLKVLIQQKGIQHPMLAGLTFSRQLV
ncbi:MAG TPA: SAM-dependent methyltransferase [Chitinophagaceae bacterium]|nr:SAM-dependent methyltransferase [Chitinophagaceae bacterium]